MSTNWDPNRHQWHEHWDKCDEVRRLQERLGRSEQSLVKMTEDRDYWREEAMRLQKIVFQHHQDAAAAAGAAASTAGGGARVTASAAADTDRTAASAPADADQTSTPSASTAGTGVVARWPVVGAPQSAASKWRERQKSAAAAGADQEDQEEQGWDGDQVWLGATATVEKTEDGEGSKD